MFGLGEAMSRFIDVCRVIMSQIGLGIEAAFWKNGQPEQTDILPLVRQDS